MADSSSQVWRVNVREQTRKQETVPQTWESLGGRGLLARIMLDETDAKCDPLGAGNKLIIAPGLLVVGHMLSSTDRISVGAKSPWIGDIKEANAGGRTGYHIAFMGLKALIIEDKPQADGFWVLHLSLNGAKWERADDLVGLGVYETAPKLLEEFGDKVAIALIGPGADRRPRRTRCGDGLERIEGHRVRSCRWTEASHRRSRSV